MNAQRIQVYGIRFGAVHLGAVCFDAALGLLSLGTVVCCTQQAEKEGECSQFYYFSIHFFTSCSILW